MTRPVYPPPSAQIAERRKELAPGIHDAFLEFSRQVFADGALDEETKQLIAVAVAHVTQCPYCIHAHTRAAMRKGASEQQLMEAIWVAAEMRAGGAYAHSSLALDTASQPHGPRAACERLDGLDHIGDRPNVPPDTRCPRLFVPRSKSSRRGH